MAGTARHHALKRRRAEGCKQSTQRFWLGISVTLGIKRIWVCVVERTPLPSTHLLLSAAGVLMKGRVGGTRGGGGKGGKEAGLGQRDGEHGLLSLLLLLVLLRVLGVNNVDDDGGGDNDKVLCVLL